MKYMLFFLMTRGYIFTGVIVECSCSGNIPIVRFIDRRSRLSAASSTEAATKGPGQKQDGSRPDHGGQKEGYFADLFPGQKGLRPAGRWEIVEL
ncbi:hypothetical protein LZZ85_12540 [Terrimonas sp. NA20]|uniref:Secreted protein n=1 Tax=Terrimonas ginsenosidimutans TaxID=2908004 RepID=A0ABS9KS30_9BACT|nr:hypothetical protein [Terrimonas ginsenosidimutans]MCG2615119.1 hypothetical protein [Terrimonas ginsenosidimutans]